MSESGSLSSGVGGGVGGLQQQNWTLSSHRGPGGKSACWWLHQEPGLIISDSMIHFIHF